MMKVAFGLRAKYAAFFLLGSTMLLQIYGALLFSGRAGAVGTVNYSTSLPATPLHITSPSAVAVDASNNVYVSVNDTAIKKVDTGGAYVLGFGSAGTGDGQFSDINGIAVDSANNIYVLDANRVQKFNSTGSFLLKWGTAGSGNSQFSGAEALAIDSSNNVYVVDRNNDRVQKFNSSGTYVSQWGSGDLDNPTGIAISSSDTVYVFDSNNYAVKSYSTSGVAGLQWGSNGTGNGEFDGVGGADVTVDAVDNVYVVEWVSGRVQRFDSSGNYWLEWGGGSGTTVSCVEGVFSETGGHNGAADIAIGSNDVVYIPDQNASTIQVFDTNGTYSEQLGKRAGGQVYAPADMASDSEGNLFVYDRGNSRIQKFDATGAFVDKWGEYGSGGSGELGTTSSECSNPSIGTAPKGYLAVGPSGKVYVVDTGNGHDRVVIYNNDGSYYSEWSLGSLYTFGIAVDSSENVYLVGAGEVRKYTASGSALTSWSTELPSGAASNYRYVGIATGPGKTVYVAVNGKVLSYSSTGTSIDSYVLTSYSAQPTVRTIPHISVDAQGSIFVTDNSTVQKLDSNGRLITYWGGAGTGNGQFGTPGAVTSDVFGKVYVSELATVSGGKGERIQVFDDTSYYLQPTTGAAQSITSVGASLKLGTNDVANYTTPDYTIEYGPTTSYGSVTSALTTSIARKSSTPEVSSTGWSGTLGTFWSRDSLGNIYITASSCRVLKFNASGDYVLQIGGTCSINSSTELGFGTGPMAFDSANHLYVADASDSQYILKYDTDGSYLGYIDAGQTNIKDLVIDAQDNLYVAFGVSTQHIDKYDAGGTLLTQWGSSGTGDGELSGTNVLLAVDAAGNVYSLDGQIGQERIQKFTTNGTYIAKWSVAANTGDIMVAGDVLYTYDYTQVAMYGLGGAALSSFSYTSPDYYGLDSANTASGEVYLKGPNGSVATYVRSGSKAVSGLTCNTLYHYRSVATAHGDTVYGDDATFTTSSCLAITTTSLPNGVVGSSYNQTVGTNRSGMVMTIDSGSLPAGLTMNSAGVISGTPSAVGTSSFTVRATDQATSETDTQALQIEVTTTAPDPFSIATTSLPNGVVDSDYSSQIDTDSQNPVSFVVQSGSLPDGLTMSTNGIISGTPTTAQTASFVVEADDGSTTDTQALSITIDPAEDNPVNPPPDTFEPPVVTDVTPEAPSIPLTPIAARKAIAATSNSIFALAKRIPEPFAIGFPWLLLLLALILVGTQYYQVHSESMATKRIQVALANQERLVEEQNNFVALSTHYLHTPLTVMEGEISLMVKAGTLSEAQATKLKATLSSLRNQAEVIVAQEENQDEPNV